MVDKLEGSNNSELYANLHSMGVDMEGDISEEQQQAIIEGAARVILQDLFRFADNGHKLSAKNLTMIEQDAVNIILDNWGKDVKEEAKAKARELLLSARHFAKEEFARLIGKRDLMRSERSNNTNNWESAGPKDRDP